MSSPLRTWSYRYQWLYDGLSRLAALSVGGENRFRRLALTGLEIQPQMQVLDLCCGSGQATAVLVQCSQQVMGLDASPRSLQRARQNVPQATFVEGFAENMPFADGQFDRVHTSMALHEMSFPQLQAILSEVYRVLKPGGVFALVDFHPPTQAVFWPGLALFFALLETETAWQFIRLDLPALLQQTGFQVTVHALYAGGSLQVLHGLKSGNISYP